MNEPLTQNPEYVQGQIDALYALVLALAQDMPKDAFLEQARTRLEAQRNVLINSPVSDARIAAVDAAIGWVKSLY